jgi:hypothetical protein
MWCRCGGRRMSKRKRARALRRLDREEAATYSSGGWVDESIPPGEVDRILDEFAVQADREAFKDYLGQRVGRYRSMREWHASQPSNAKELELLEETMDVILELRTRLANLPPGADAHINHIAWKRRGELFHAYHKRLDADLQEAWNMLALTERELDIYKGRAGAKRKFDRDSFLSDVAEWLTTNAEGMTEPQAFKVTHRLCLALQVEVPEYTDDDPAKFGSIIRGHRQHVQEQLELQREKNRG